MLSNLFSFPSWTQAEQAPSSSSSTTATTQQPSRNHEPSSSTLFGEDLLITDSDDDAAVDKLLSQFPPYGSCATRGPGSSSAGGGGVGVGGGANNSSLTHLNSSNSNNMAALVTASSQSSVTGVVVATGDLPIVARTAQEWLQLGVVGDDNAEDTAGADGTTVPHATTGSHHHLPNNKTPSATTVTPPITEWDIEEQTLWNTHQPTAITTTAANTAMTMMTTTTTTTPLLMRPLKFSNNTELQQRLQLTAQQQHHQQPQQQPQSQRNTANTTTTGTMDDRQHWMPDQLCKQCYLCDTHFSVFRRRHHCRFCGQVFCNTCSAYFVPVRKGTVRTCKVCFDQVTEQGGYISADQSEDQQEWTRGTLPGSVVTDPTNTTSTTVLLDQAMRRTLPLQKQQLHNLKNRHGFHPDEANNPMKRMKRPVDDTRKITDPAKEGHIHLGKAAANHLEAMAAELLRIHAPLLWNSLGGQHGRTDKKDWINQLLTLATRCCKTVDPNVKNGDLLDIRPYCKIKVIPGGSFRDCAYLSGVLFRKTVSHKKMAKCVSNPRIMLLSGSIEFTRTENQITSLETLFEQEDKYMEILVGKILKLKPDVLLVSRSVSRKAQELLLKADVILVQHVKSSLLSRIARQTGATMISGTDHVMSQFGTSVLGRCSRFRLVTVRDTEMWTDRPFQNTQARSIDAVLREPVDTVEREAALAAKQLGESIMDGSEAVRAGLAKRGVTHTFVMLEGCPKHLGCTVVLRGASRVALKQVKTVFRFLINVAYNLRLETSYLKERGGRLRPDFRVLPCHTFSSSLAVDYKSPTQGRRNRPWNGGNTTNENVSEITAFDHQAILITSVWMTDKSQCCPAELKGICYYSMQDVSLGQFLRDSCFNLSLKCQNPNCKKSVLDHSLSFVHNDGLLNITVEKMETALPCAGEKDREEKSDVENTNDEDDDLPDKPIATWTFCRKCRKVVTPLVFISENTWKFSFGKFLEVFFYNRDAILNSSDQQCSCNLQKETILYFGCGKLAARFTYESVSPYGVFVRKNLPIFLEWHRQEATRQLRFISEASSDLFVKFDKHIEKVTREARSLFNTAINRPEHLQTVLSELNRIGSEVDHAAKTLQEKIASVTESFCQTNELSLSVSLLRFPWLAKRYLFMLMSAWNEKLSAAGQAISAMKRLAGGSNVNAAAVVSDPLHDELLEGIKRLQELNERYSRYNVTDINQSLPSLPFGNVLADGDFDDEFDDPDTSIDFSDGVDADVLASRRRLKHTGGKNSKLKSGKPSNSPSKSLGTRRTLMDAASSEALSIPPKSTPGGAVKSAITRFFNRGGRDNDAYIIDLGSFKDGRPRLSPGLNGEVVPVIDEQLSTIIAYSLVSSEYAKQFRAFSRTDALIPDDELALPERSRPAGLPDPNGRSTRKPIDPAGDLLGSADGSSSTFSSDTNSRRDVERRILNRTKSHIKLTFRDYDEKGRVTCKFVCTSYWATQFQAVREVFLSQVPYKADDKEETSQSHIDTEQSYITSLSSAYSWAASGGKSGATFARTSDDRFVIKNISRTELQMFLECSSAYFEYLSKAFFHGLPTVLCKIVGVYQIGVHNRTSGKRTIAQVAVMQNIFYNKKISKIFDLKGSLRGRFAAQIQRPKEEGNAEFTLEGPILARKRSGNDKSSDDGSTRDGDNSLIEPLDNKIVGPISLGMKSGPATLLDGDFLEYTAGRPMPLTDRAKALFQMSILNDTLFLSLINVLDYSILVGVDDESNELVVGIIDFMRQYDILKQMERVGKSLPMVVGSEAPTIIQPPLYKSRFTNAMERYFMTVPDKWTNI